MYLTETDDGKWDATLKAFWRRMSLHSRSKFWDKADIPEDEMYIFRAHFATALLASPIQSTIKAMEETAKDASIRVVEDNKRIYQLMNKYEYYKSTLDENGNTIELFKLKPIDT